MPKLTQDWITIIAEILLKLFFRLIFFTAANAFHRRLNSGSGLREVTLFYYNIGPIGAVVIA